MEKLQKGFFRHLLHNFNTDALVIPTCQWINNPTEDNITRKRTIAITKNELQYHHRLSITRR
jgi:hypothetical protein